jgi:hypothetical protein
MYLLCIEIDFSNLTWSKPDVFFDTEDSLLLCITLAQRRQLTLKKTKKEKFMKINVVLNLASTTNAELAAAASNYTQCISSDPTFPEADFKSLVTQVNTSNTRFQSLMMAPISESKTEDVRAAREDLELSLQVLANEVEALANKKGLTDDERVAVVHRAGMQVKAKAPKKKRTFDVVAGDAPGTAEMTAEGGPRAHEWQMTHDVVNFTSRVQLPTTTAGITTVTGLQPGTVYAFYHRGVVAGKVQEWEGPILFTAK